MCLIERTMKAKGLKPYPPDDGTDALQMTSSISVRKNDPGRSVYTPPSIGENTRQSARPQEPTPASTRKMYSRVRVLIISWEDQDLNLDVAAHPKELQDVHDYFHDFVGVDECDKWQIPRSPMPHCFQPNVNIPEQDLKLRLEEFKGKYDRDENELVIVYYSGHGSKSTSQDGETALVWSSGGPHGQYLWWNDLQWDCLFGGNGHAVAVINCCDAASAIHKFSCAPSLESPGVACELGEEIACAFNAGTNPFEETPRDRCRIRRTVSSWLHALFRRREDGEDILEKVEKLDCGTPDDLPTIARSSTRNDILAACPEDSATSGPGPDSFTARLLRAGRFKKPFTLQDWVIGTHSLSTKEGQPLPVYQSYGDDEHDIWLHPASCRSKS